MTDTAAPPALAFRRRSMLERLVLDPGLEIGAGGEAVAAAPRPVPATAAGTLPAARTRATLDLSSVQP